MILRITRRLPWIALGAAGGFYLDPHQGGRRRRELGTRATGWAQGARAWLSGADQDASRASARDSGVAPGESPPSPPSAPFEALPEDDERVRARAAEPLAEETAAGVPSPAPTAMAERILEESEARVLGRPH